MQWMQDMKKRKREVKDDTKLFGLGTWEDGVAFN